MTAYLQWVVTRFQGCFRRGAFPYERRVCSWAFEIRVVFILAGAGLVSMPVWAWWSRLVLALSPWMSTPLAQAVLIVAGVYLAHRGGWLGGFVWADLGPEERFREALVGCSFAPRIFPIGTLESAVVCITPGPLMDAWHQVKFLRDPANLFFGDIGGGRYDVLPPEDTTWAMRLHHRWVRPRLIRRGVPGYERKETST